MSEVKEKKNKFCQADELIKSFHRMNNNELKFMFYALSKRGTGEIEINTSLKDLFSQLNIEWGGEQVKTYQRTIKSIIQKSVLNVFMTKDRLSEKDRKRLKNDEDSVLVSGALLSAKLWSDMSIDITFNKDFIPLLEDLKHDFTWIYLEQMARLNGKYSPRIYEWCKMQLKDKNECKFIWYLNSESKDSPGIRQWLNVDNKYSDWFNFRRRVLQPSFDEINEKTSDVEISYKPLRNGARTPIYALEMIIRSKHESEYEKKKRTNLKLNNSKLEDKNSLIENEHEKMTKRVERFNNAIVNGKIDFSKLSNEEFLKIDVSLLTREEKGEYIELLKQKK